jgi:hypothetical protein
MRLTDLSGHRHAFPERMKDNLTHSLKDEFASLQIGPRAQFRNLTLFPLLRAAPASPEPDYLLAETAIAQGLARVTELEGGGSVPELRFENHCAQSVLLLDGEELLGAKQNRVLNLTVLAPAKQTIVIPVSCVEAGRWRAQSAEFKPAPHMMYSKARAARAGQVTESMRREGTRRSDQAAVWSEIASKAARMAAPSPTQALSAVYERHTISVEEYVRAFQCQERQAGVAFAIDGQVQGLDLFDHPATMRRMFPKLLRSYALDALETSGEGKAGDADLPDFLGRLAGAQSFVQPALSLGQDVRLTGDSVSGAALWAGQRYVHLCAFARQGNGGGGFSTRMVRPALRRQS